MPETSWADYRCNNAFSFLLYAYATCTDKHTSNSARKHLCCSAALSVRQLSLFVYTVHNYLFVRVCVREIIVDPSSSLHYVWSVTTSVAIRSLWSCLFGVVRTSLFLLTTCGYEGEMYCFLCVICLLSRRPFTWSANVSIAFSTVFCTSFHKQGCSRPFRHYEDITCMSCHKWSTHTSFVEYVKITFHYILISARS